MGTGNYFFVFNVLMYSLKKLCSIQSLHIAKKIKVSIANHQRKNPKVCTKERCGQNIPQIADRVDWYISTSGHSYQKWCTVWDSLIQAKWQTQRSHMSCAKEAFSVLRAQGVIFSAGVSELHSQKEYIEAGALNSFWFVTLENVSAECLGAYKKII